MMTELMAWASPASMCFGLGFEKTKKVFDDQLLGIFDSMTRDPDNARFVFYGYPEFIIESLIPTVTCSLTHYCNKRLIPKLLC